MAETIKKPLIMVVNDDGITAPGIRALIGFMLDLGDVFVVAPNKSMSGMGHAITIDSTLRFTKHNGEYANVEEYSCSGTPVDCVKFGTEVVANGRTVDLVVSGINHGSNSSINVIYSGTMSAAIEGAIEGIPSIGFSLCNHSLDADFKACENIVKSIVKNTLKKGSLKNYCLNVNIPAIPAEEIKGIKICRQAKAFWEKDFQERKDPMGNSYYWLAGKFNNQDDGTDTDIWALENNYVSVVPTMFDLTAHEAIADLKSFE
jgi:5'-nucleotidase